MPGFNKNGPMNEGSMTGRQLGQCAARYDQETGAAQSAAGNMSDYGGGRCRRMGRRGFQRPRWGMDVAGSQIHQQSQSAREETLEQRAQLLELELAAIKNELKQMEKQ